MRPKDSRDTHADGAAPMPRAAEWARVWRDPRITGLELLRATYVTHAFARHAHDTFALGVVEEGAQSFMYRGARQTTPPGGIILVNPDEPTTGEAASASGYTYRMLYPDVALPRHAAAEVAGRSRGLPFFRVPVVQDDYMARLLCGLHRTMEGPAPMLERESRLLETLTQLIVRHATPRPALAATGRDRAAIRRAREYIDAHDADDVSLQQLARLVNLSPYYLVRAFRQETGLPPHAYLETVRVARARRLLSRGEPLARVAQDTGFVDQSHFTNRFKRLVGVTPGQYVQQGKILQDGRA